jgi:beta-lactamase superfamily II metal-dependent hydrolase
VARATGPEQITVRMYQVGFGDSFLVSLSYRRRLADGRAERHLLVDFGSTHAPRRQRVDMAALANRIGDDCGGKLDVVVVTHRHKDHLSGFANDEAAAVIEALDPALVVQPWTEDPKAPAGATGPVGAASRRLLAALAAGDDFAGELSRAMASGRSSGVRAELRELAEDQLKNAEASGRLNQWAAERDGEYLHVGAASKIGQVVPGLGVEVLGPPTVDQHPDVANERARDPEYWMLYRGLVSTGLPMHTLSGADGDGADPDDAEPDGDGPAAAAPEGFRAARERGIPAGPARWLAERLRRQQLHSLQRIVRSLDDTLNNTSLVLLLSAGSRRLLFPGDAQIENWRYTLDRLPKDRALRRRLGEVDLYKVGHHGSRNATPRSLLELWDGDPPLVALLSTRPGAHGKTEATAVPRATLVAALEERAELYSTEGLDEGGAVVVQADARGRERFRP